MANNSKTGRLDLYRTRHTEETPLTLRVLFAVAQAARKSDARLLWREKYYCIRQVPPTFSRLCRSTHPNLPKASDRQESRYVALF